MGKVAFQEPAAKMDVYISADSCVKGHLQTKSNIRIDGKINGNINAAGNVHVGSNALVEGNITGIDVQIAGIVRGNINVTGGLHVYSSAKLIGDVKAASVEVEQGAQYKGTMAVGGPIDENALGKDDTVSAAAKEPASQPQAADKEPAAAKEPAEKAAPENGKETAKNQPIMNVFKNNHKK
jgi:cytoskeletal protein CcmA (bactofilin family)